MSTFRTLCFAILAITPITFACAEPVTDVAIPTGDPDALKQALENRGWRVEKDSSGDLLVYPARQDDASSSTTSENPNIPAATDRTIDSGQLGELEAIARKRGWKVERNTAGDVLLYPRIFVDDVVVKKAGSDKKSASANPTTDTTIDATSLDRLEKTLGEKGWQVERNAAGDLLLYPAAENHNEAKNPVAVHVTRLDDCVKGAKETIYPEQLSLPLRNEADAKKIAEAWLTVFGKGADTIGKIRRVNMLYIVSIVSSEPPYALLRQLVIDERTGNVISIP